MPDSSGGAQPAPPRGDPGVTLLEPEDRPTPPATTPAQRRPTAWTVSVVAAGLAAVVLVAVMVVVALRWDWLAVGDFGILALRVADVGGADTPLVGVYSRWEWNHPGPLLFYALAPTYRLTGEQGHGLLLGALVVNVLAAGGALAVAARAGRRHLAVVALVLALLLVGLSPGELLDPWNPFVLILPLFAAAIAAWRCALGDRLAAVVLVVATSFAVQSHVAAGPPALALLAVGGVGLALRALRGPERRHDRRTVLVAVGAAAVCWAAPVWQQLTGSPGNLGEIVSFALGNDEPVNGWSSGARSLARVLTVPPQWITGHEEAIRTTPFPYALVLLGVATAWAVHRRWRDELVLCVTALALLAAAFVGASRIAGIPYPYLFRWLWVPGAVAWVAIVAVGLAELRRHRPGAAALDAVLMGVTAVLLVAMSLSAPDPVLLRRSDEPLRTFAPVVEPTLQALEDVPGPTVVTLTNHMIDAAVGNRLLELAEDEGIDLRYPDDLAYVVGAHRTIDPAEARQELVLASDGAEAAYASDPGYRLVTELDPLSPEERAEYDALAAVDWDTRPDGPFAPGPQYRRFRELSDRSETLAVFLSE